MKKPNIDLSFGKSVKDQEEIINTRIRITETAFELTNQGYDISKFKEVVEALEGMINGVGPEGIELDRRRIGGKGIPKDEQICKAIEALKQAKFES